MTATRLATRAVAAMTSTQALRAATLTMSCLLIAALLPPSPASATSRGPWDEPGSRWEGRIETDWSYKQEPAPTQWTDKTYERAVYTDLKAQGGTADGDYSVTATAEAAHLYHYTDCYYTGQPHTNSAEYRGSVSTDAEIHLQTNDQGQTFFTPQGAGWFPGTYTNTCTEKGTPLTFAHNGGIGYAFGLGYGSDQYSSSPLNDEDADPRHLVGTRTWTIGDWPHAPFNSDHGFEQYTYTVTYDLWLVNGPVCDSHVAHDVYRASVGDAERLEFELRTFWCTLDDGTMRFVDVSAQKLTLNSPLEAALESVVHELFTLHDVWRKTTIEKSISGDTATVIARGRWEHCFGLPLAATRIYKIFKNAATYVSDRLAGVMRKAARLAREVGAEAVDGFLAKLPKTWQRRITVAVSSLVLDWSISAQWARDYVKDFLRDFADSTISRLLGDELICRAGWKPKIVQTLRSDGTFDSRFVNVDGDTPTWIVERSGGNAT